ncbi:MAG: hypothetical protein SFV81_19705 [Pirellulaceae bacterium]|nr:hypothetical protein [Pirellulaceae bacterium]
MRRKPIHRECLCLALMWLCAMTPCGTLAFATDGDDLTLQTMCQQGLTESAILYATAELNRVRTNPDAYARWTQRLIECEAQAALRAEGQADVHWKRCREIYEQFKRDNPKDRRLPWLEWQVVRCDLLLAQDSLARWLAAPANGPIRDKALELIRKILTDLNELENDLKQRQPLAAKLPANDLSQATPEQISQLRLDTVLCRCEAYLIRARLYESRSRDRVGAAANVESEAGALLDRTTKDWPTRSSLEVARATAWLELDRETEAIALLQSVVLHGNDQAARVRAAVVACEALVSQGQTSQAAAFVAKLKELEAGPEWELAEIRLSLSELGVLPADKKEAEISKLLARAKEIGERFGDYWRARVDSILARSVSSNEVSSGNATELVMVEVRQLLAGGDEKNAIAKLLASSRNELASGRKANAVQLANQASALLQRQQAWLAAADAIEEIAVQAPEVDGAAAGHLTAAWSLSQALKPNPQDQQLRTRYTQALKDHIRNWPNGETTDQAIKWLQGWLMASGNQDELLPILRRQAEQATAPEKAREALYGWLGILLNSPSKRESEIASLQQSLTDGNLKSIEATVRIAILTATVIPDWSEAAVVKRNQATIDALANAATAATDNQLLTTAYWLLAARNGDAKIAKTVADLWNAAALPADMVEPIAAAVIDVIDTLPTNDLPEWATKVRFTEAQLLALSQSNRLTSRAIAWRLRGLQPEKQAEAIAGLREVCKQNPKLGVLHLQLANMLAKQDATSRRESSEIARQLVANSPQASDLFYGARWRLIRNQMLDGKQVEAQKAAKLVLATLADESVTWRVRFGKLLATDTR